MSFYDKCLTYVVSGVSFYNMYVASFHDMCLTLLRKNIVYNVFTKCCSVVRCMLIHVHSHAFIYNFEVFMCVVWDALAPGSLEHVSHVCCRFVLICVRFHLSFYQCQPKQGASA